MESEEEEEGGGGRLAAEEARVSTNCADDLLAPLWAETRERGERELAEGDLVIFPPVDAKVGEGGARVLRGKREEGGVEGGVTRGEEGERRIEREVGVEGSSEEGEGEGGEGEGEREAELRFCLVAEATVVLSRVATIIAKCL